MNKDNKLINEILSNTEAPLSDEFSRRIYNKVKFADEKELKNKDNIMKLFLKLASGMAVIILLAVVFIKFNPFDEEGSMDNKIAQFKIGEALAQSIENTFVLGGDDQFMYREISLFNKLETFGEYIDVNYIIKTWEYKDNARMDYIAYEELGEGGTLSFMESTIENKGCHAELGYEETPYQEEEFIQCTNFGIERDADFMEDLYTNNNQFLFSEVNDENLEVEIVEKNNKKFIQWETGIDDEFLDMFVGIDGQVVLGDYDLEEHSIKQNDKYIHGFEINKEKIQYVLPYESDVFQFQITTQFGEKKSRLFEYNFKNNSIEAFSSGEFENKIKDIEKQSLLTSQYKNIFVLPLELINKTDILNNPNKQEEIEIDGKKYIKIQYNLPKEIKTKYFAELGEEEIVEFVMDKDKIAISEYSVFSKEQETIQQVKILEEKAIDNINPEEFFTEEYWREDLK